MKLLFIFFISASLLSCTKQKEKPMPVPQVVVKDTAAGKEAARRDSVVAFAKEYLGTKYCYAGSTPESGFDCSGFVNFVYARFGIELPRSSSGFKDLGTDIQPKEFKKGDVLVFYGYRDSDSVGHVGIITEAKGMDSKFIHASSGSEMAVIISELGSDMYTRRFYKCIDVIGNRE